MMRSIRSFLKRRLPTWLYHGLAALWHLPAECASRLRHQRVEDYLKAISGMKVMTGPFAGMTLAGWSTSSEYLPKIVGSYESQLHPYIHHFASSGYQRIINVGAGEGYYIVGLGKLLADADLFAFETDPMSRNLCLAAAKANGCESRLTVLGEADLDSFRNVLVPRSLIFMDCEGCEISLLDPNAAPLLNQSDVIVELHDFLNPSISSTIRGRFQNTHLCTFVSADHEDPNRYPFLNRLSGRDAREAVWEHRPAGMRWAILESCLSKVQNRG
jgi:hypothetical protein